MGKNTQYFEWGHIEWIYEPDPGSSKNNMSIGITTILPNMKQNKHIHYGDEQFIYVLSGEGIQLIGSKISEMKPKQIYHMEAGTIHETINNRDVPIKHLLISIPASYDQNIPFKEDQSEIAGQSIEFDENIKLDEEIRYIYNTIVAPLNIAVTIFDEEGKVIIQGQDYPKTCRDECLVDGRIRNCPMYSLKGEYDYPHYADTSAYICPYGLTVISIPVVIGGNVIGVIKGGHIRTAAENSTSKEDIVPKGTVNAVLMQLRKLSDGIQNHYIFKNEELKLNRQENLYKATLKSAKEKMLNIQISNHFLFNTLNALAGMAVKEKAFGTYQSIIDVSGMLRYISTNENRFVQLRDELQYINNYTNLQKLRCGDKLKIITDISPEIHNANIPFNCLQPIVENCFIHGFKDMKGEMRINITGKLAGNKVVLEIKDNGEGMAEDTLEKLREKIRNYEKYNIRGMMMVYSKLKLFFEDDFEFSVYSKEGEGTAVKISYNI
jgi:mannose-6-phosphate isomerase-like protein (cupin superfamily)/ligand-binding sensor protein